LPPLRLPLFFFITSSLDFQLPPKHETTPAGPGFFAIAAARSVVFASRLARRSPLI